MAKQRLQKLISSAGICSRRHAEKLIEQGLVTVNGQPAQIGDLADSENDAVIVNGSPLKIDAYYKVILINKPIGVISSCQDPRGRTTVISLIPSKLRKGLYPVGRLDFDSRGALLLTNHGKLTLELTHPRYAHTKTYEAWVKGRPSSDSLSKWRDGILLDGKPTLSADIELLEAAHTKSLLQIILREGRNRQIRRIADLLGHPVIDLKRTAIAELQLNGLEEGQWRLIPKRKWSQILTVGTSNR